MAIKIRPLVYKEHREDPPFPYQTVQIGNQIWMAENLSIDDGGEGIITFNSVISESVEFGPQTYYTWDAAVRVANSIPGWHLPSFDEWTTLSNYYDIASNNARSTEGWNYGNNGTNLLGLNIQPLGRVDSWQDPPYYLSAVGGEANFWCSNNLSSSAGAGSFFYVWGWNSALINWNKNNYNSVRLVKD